MNTLPAPITNTRPDARPFVRLACAALFAVVALAGCAQKAAQTTKQYAFWPPYPDEPRLQFLCSFASSANVEAQKSALDELVYGKEAQDVQNLVKPYGVDMHAGKIYVCDLRSASVTILDIPKQQTLVMGRSGTETLQTPTDIAIAPDGTKYVADIGRGRIFVFDGADRYVGSFGIDGWRPVGVAVFENELFVCDFANQCVQVLDRRTGSPTRRVGAPGQENGQFVRPLGISVDDKGNLYVADVLNCRLQKFDRAGNFVSAFGMISANVGGMVRPKHIDVDREGIIYVVDAAFQNVQLFDQVGQVFTYFGSAGTHPGAMYLPAGVHIDDDPNDLTAFSKYLHPSFEMKRLVLVTNQFGPNKVSVYAFGGLKPGATVKDVEASKDVVRLGAQDATKARTIGPSTLPASPPDDFQNIPVPPTPGGPQVQPAPGAAPPVAPAAAPAPAGPANARVSSANRQTR